MRPIHGRYKLTVLCCELRQNILMTLLSHRLKSYNSSVYPKERKKEKRYRGEGGRKEEHEFLKDVDLNLGKATYVATVDW